MKGCIGDSLIVSGVVVVELKGHSLGFQEMYTKGEKS
jgi:hypothetical protein